MVLGCSTRASKLGDRGGSGCSKQEGKQVRGEEHQHQTQMLDLIPLFSRHTSPFSLQTDANLCMSSRQWFTNFDSSLLLLATDNGPPLGLQSYMMHRMILTILLTLQLCDCFYPDNNVHTSILFSEGLKCSLVQADLGSDQHTHNLFQKCFPTSMP